VKLTYQWLRDGKTIGRGTGRSYTVKASDRRHKISVRVIGTKTGYRTASKTSAAKLIR
jgi:hypothetical protein